MADHELYLDLLKRCLTGYLFPDSSNQEVRPDRNMPATRRWVFRWLKKSGYKVFKVVPFDREARENGRDWPSIGYSMVGLKRLDHLQMCIQTVVAEGVPGDLLEAGVWRGGSCIFMRAVLKLLGVTDRKVWVADSFQGLPRPSLEADADYDLSEYEILAVSQEEVEANFARFGMLDGQVKFLKGWFKDTLAKADVSRLSILRLDGDLYESTTDILNGLYHKVSAGGFVIVDDYGMVAPCKQAIHDFRERKAIQDTIVDIDGSAVYWRKSG
jgi:hypothetical protein